MAVALVLCVAGLYAVWHIKSSAQQAAEQAPPSASVLTAPVTQDVLTQQVILRGTVVGNSADVRSLIAASPAIVTGLPLAPGAAVNEGDVLAEVSGRPIFALTGDVPAYRPMAPDTAGKDVAELQASLQRLGLLSGKFKSGTFDAPTGAAVTKLYKNHGYAPSCDGAPVDVCLGEVVFLPSLPGTIGKLGAGLGDDAAGAQPLVTVQLGDATVSGVVPGGQDTGLAAGLPVLVADDGSQRQCDGTLTSVGAYQAAAADGSTSAGYPVSVSAGDCIGASWLGLNVRLVITVQSTQDTVLIVPTSAIQTDADGTTYVQVHAAGVADRRVNVTTGLIAGGEVAVTPAAVTPAAGASLAAGDLVVTG